MSGPRVLVPYVRLHPAVPGAMMHAGATVRYELTSESISYWRVLMNAWEEGESFIVVEQDKVPAPGLLEELWDCPRDWCSVRTPMRGTVDWAPYPSLSCTKFSGALIGRHQSLLEDLGGLDLGFGEKEWSRLDLGIAGLLEGRGEQVHWHDGVVEHLHDG